MDNKQIEEMRKDICQSDFCASDCRAHCHYGENSYCWDVEILADRMYNKGYRKEKQGEWEYNDAWSFPMCSLCGGYNVQKTPYCPFCGARLKGGAE